MKKAIAIIILGLLFISVSSQADDIRDFQIEGISIGDSALDFFSEEKINKSEKVFYPKSKKFYDVQIKSSKFGDWEEIVLSFKENDTKYIIHAIDGGIIFENRMQECYKMKDDIVEELSSSILKGFKKNSYISPYKIDGGKSKSHVVDFSASDGYIRVWCTDWSKEIEEEKNFVDHIRLSASTNEFMNWLDNEAY